MAQMTAPAHLKAPTKRWWVQVCGNYDLEEHHIRLLTMACEAWDRSQEAREALKKAKSLTYVDRWGCPKKRPEVSIQNESMITFARLVRELGPRSRRESAVTPSEAASIRSPARGADLPVIDIAGLSSEAGADAPRGLVDEISTACAEWGAFQLVGALAVRYLARAAYTIQGKSTHQRPHKLLIFGAGVAGLGAAHAIMKDPKADALPVAFLDDEPAKHGSRPGGLPVVGDREWIAHAAQRYNADTLLIAMPSAPLWHIPSLRQARAVQGVSAGRQFPGVPSQSRLIFYRRHTPEGIFVLIFVDKD